VRLLRLIKPLAAVAALAAGAAGYATRDRWLPLVQPAQPAGPAEAVGESETPAARVVVGEQAQLNLGLTAKPLAAQTYWRTIPVPGMVVDRPGQSDRGVVSPATGVVAAIARFPGDTVRPGDPLFTVRVLSEALHLTQTELFKAAQDITLAEAQRKRLADAAGVVSEARLIEVDSQITRLRVSVNAYRQELLSRGFAPAQIDAVAGGTFAREIPVAVPARPADAGAAAPATYELQELKVELGQQVQAGQTLCLIADHRKLAVEGRAFRDETPLLERSVREGWPVAIDFQEDPSDWPALGQPFQIRQLANSIDPATRTFAFRVPLENQSRAVEQDGRTQTLWRYRPGQKVRLEVRVERLDGVFVLPADAVASDGPEAFVFTQNVNTFERRPVRVLLRDRRQVVLADDGSLPPGSYVVQSGAAQLARMAKAGGGGVPKGYHIHADGSLHKNEDEGK